MTQQSDLRIHFSLTRQPFSPMLKTGELYVRPCMDEMAEQMEFAIANGFYYTVLGEVGAGKSTALSYALSRLGGKRFEIVSVVGCTASFPELCRQVLIGMNVSVRTGQLSRLLKTIGEAFASIFESGRTPVVVIDEAHLFNQEVFQQLHVVSQQVPAGKTPVPLVLCGQELLFERLSGPFSKPLMSRIMDGCNLSGMSQAECAEYIEHHLGRLCGGRSGIFDQKAVVALSQSTAGIPRRINETALLAMRNAMRAGRTEVVLEDVRKASGNWWDKR